MTLREAKRELREAQKLLKLAEQNTNQAMADELAARTEVSVKRSRLVLFQEPLTRRTQ